MSKLLKDIAERALSSAAQAAVAVVAVAGFDFFNTHDLAQAGKVAVIAGVLAILKGLAASHIGNSDSASLFKDI